MYSCLDQYKLLSIRLLLLVLVLLQGCFISGAPNANACM